MDYTPPDSSVHGIPQARLEWVAISFSRGSSPLRDPIQVSWIAGDLLHRKQILYGLSHQGSQPPGKPLKHLWGPVFLPPTLLDRIVIPRKDSREAASSPSARGAALDLSVDTFLA